MPRQHLCVFVSEYLLYDKLAIRSVETSLIRTDRSKRLARRPAEVSVMERRAIPRSVHHTTVFGESATRKALTNLPATIIPFIPTNGDIYILNDIVWAVNSTATMQ